MQRIFSKVFFFSFLMTSTLSAQIIYVDSSAVLSGDGSTWTNAYSQLQYGLSAAQPGNQIWVAAGTYFPTDGDDRNARFELPKGVKLFGGFSGSEVTLNERDWVTNTTVLSGDIGLQGDSTDNSHTILYLPFPDTNTWVDGFVVRYGNADGSGTFFDPARSGGGIFIDGRDGHAYPRIRHCRFEKNHARYFGGGAFVDGRDDGSAAPQFFDCEFNGNTARSGGGIYRYGGSWEEVENDFWQCSFTGNFAENDGGGISYFETERQDTIEYVDCKFNSNMSGNLGSAIYIASGRVDGSKTEIVNSIFENNIALEAKYSLYYSVDFNFSETDFISIVGCQFVNNQIDNILCEILPLSSQISKLKIEDCYFDVSGNKRCVFESSGTSEIEIRQSHFDWQNTYGLDVSIFGFDQPRISGCKFSGYRGNELGLGGHEEYLRFDADSIIFTNSLFYNNKTIFDPLTAPSSLFDINVSYNNCTFINNLSEFINLNLTLNDTKRHYFFRNCIIHDSTLTLPVYGESINLENTLIKAPDCESILDGNDIIDLTCGPGMLYNLAPLFLDTAAHDFRLSPCSPARNAGDNAAALAAGLTTDINGLGRIQEGTVDMGAHETPPFSVTLDTIVDVGCAGESTGSFTVGVHSGCGPFALSFNGTASPADTSASITLDGLFATGYEVTVGDSQGRTDTLDLEIASPPAIGADIDHTEVDCALSLPASASAMASGGTGPISFLWGNGDNGTFTENLGTGQHHLTLTDSLNCSVTDSFWVGFTGALPLGSESADVTCFGEADGTAALLPGGLSPHFFQWENGAADSLLEDLGPGQYSATVTDALGCRDSVQLEITQPDSLVLAVSGTDTLCFGAMDGQLAGVPSGGTPGYLFEWENGPADSLFSGLPEGGYSLTVTDANGCTAMATATIAEAGAITAQATVTHATGASVADGSIELTATGGGQPPFTYLWSNGGTGTGIDGLPTGGYSLTVTDADSCQQVFGFFVDFGTSAAGKFADGPEIRLAPNPVAAGSGFYLFAKAQKAQAVSLALYGLDGKIMWDKRVELPSGESGHLLEAPKLAGAYFLMVENGKGELATLKLTAF